MKTGILGVVAVITPLLAVAQDGTRARIDAHVASLIGKVVTVRGDPSQLRMALAANPVVLNAALWNDRGGLVYPGDDAFGHVSFDLSRDDFAAFDQMRTTGAAWLAKPGLQNALYHCANDRPVCLLLDGAELAAALDLQPEQVQDSLLEHPSARGLWLWAGLALSLVLGAVLLLRWRAAPRSVCGATPEREVKEIPIGDLMLYPTRMSATRAGLDIDLTPRDLSILLLLQDRRGDVISKDDLYDAAWGRDFMPNSRALDQHMLNLRRKLDPDRSRPQLIETVRGAGYRLLP